MRTYTLEIYVRTMSAQYPHYVRTTSHEGYMSHKGDVVRTLFGHISPGICPHYILLRCSAWFISFLDTKFMISGVDFRHVTMSLLLIFGQISCTRLILDQIAVTLGFRPNDLFTVSDTCQLLLAL